MTDQEINEAVARKLGWKRYEEGVCPIYGHGAGGGHYCKDGEIYDYTLPDYCGSIQAAWEICEKIKNGVLLTLWWHDGEWECDIESSRGEIQEKADTAPRAICLAFLKLEEK